MHYKQIIRTNPVTGAVERPWRNRDHLFLLGDPSKGAVRHHDEHAKKVDNYGEALELVEQGFSIRMSDGKAPPSLVTPAALTFVDEPIKTIDDLWTYTMPDVPFTREALERDVRAALLSYAAEIYWLADQDAANAFIGFPFDIDEVQDRTQADQIDLGRFNFARVLFNAYESAYRAEAARLISDEDVDELEVMIGAMFAGAGRRYDNPADRRGSPLRQTILSAYLRWQISDGNFTVGKIDQSLVENLAILSRMTEQAVRNSLNKEGLSSKGDIDYHRILKWLEHRRDFVPLREDEKPETRSTWNVLNAFRTLDLEPAFAAARACRSIDHPTSDLADLERQIAEFMTANQKPSIALLRAYARELELRIDVFVLAFANAVRGT